MRSRRPLSPDGGGTEGLSLRIILAGRILDWRILMFTSTFAVGPRRWALDPGALRPLIDSYVAHLASRGYEAATIHHLEHSARHFCYWLNHSGIAVSDSQLCPNHQDPNGPHRDRLPRPPPIRMRSQAWPATSRISTTAAP